MKRLLLIILFALLTACGPTRSVFPPSVRVQGIHSLKNGHWQVTLRLQNNAWRAVRFKQLTVRLDIGTRHAGNLKAMLDLDIAATASDIAILNLIPSPAARAILAQTRSGNIAYSLQGTILVIPESDSTRQYPVHHQGYLSPTPGISGVWR